jgi:type VI secretion system secreted protein VgrG
MNEVAIAPPLNPTLFIADKQVELAAVTGSERVGRKTVFDCSVATPHVLKASDVLRGSAVLLLPGPHGVRAVHGVITELVALATPFADADTNVARRYRVKLESTLALLDLRRDRFVFQQMTAPEIVRAVFERAGLPPDQFADHTQASHAQVEYVTQYDETDASFIRRICEEYGLFLRFAASDGFDIATLEDTSSAAPDAIDEPMLLVDSASLHPSRPTVFQVASRRTRLPGKVVLRDYARKNPSLSLEGKADGGLDAEQRVEVYIAPGKLQTPSEGSARAKLVLESLRSTARVIKLRTRDYRVVPGTILEIEVDKGYEGHANPEGRFFIVAVQTRWSHEPAEADIECELVPADVPYRLPRSTARPRAPGLETAIVTGAPGEEIHADGDGCVKVHFPWDRHGPIDDKSSLPVRVVHPNMPGSMLIPRIGWEVQCAFEDGDPDRPYVLGRTYNGKWLPPFGLPANKTMTALSTISSPGGGAQNAMHIDDAAGRQHMSWIAGLGKTLAVAVDMLTQTVGFEQRTVDGSQSFTIGGNENISVHDAYVQEVGSQTASVGAVQKILVKAAAATKVSSETVAVGGALLEQVGNPVDGAKGFAQAAALAGAGMIPVVGPALSKTAGAAIAIGKAYAEGGTDAALEVAGQQAVGVAADFIPAGDALVAAADASGLPPWSDKAKARKAAEEAGGGTGGDGGRGAAAAAAAPGHRKTIVDGAVAETIGGALSMNSPGPIKLTGVGLTSFGIGGSHSTKAVMVSQLTGGACSDTVASLDVKTSLAIGRTVGSLSCSVGGPLDCKAGAGYDVKAGGDLTLKVGGPVVAKGGSVVFQVGGSVLAVHGGGIQIKSDSVKMVKAVKQSAKGTMK